MERKTTNVCKRHGGNGFSAASAVLISALMVLAALPTVNAGPITAIAVTAPNGAETWSGTQAITWTATGGAGTDNVKIEYSANSGGTWTTIIASVAATPSTYNWNTVGKTDGTAYKIKISDVATPATFDVSDADFTIDNTASTVTSVSSTTANGAYKAASVITVTVTFNEAVTVTGVPQIQLETGSVDRVATYAGGSGTVTLSFTYT
ncbi:MAG: hypothetical protein PHH26_08855, partial [Candidatus Thermoplasmatota archaeon]|nr:hypothetical protein [Candidatus Thermoplasmatota archaeon]